ncbi:MAG TPA: hypothetical protein VGS20_05135 [Candidatus Acidoferrales bacterium]|nr:hypothetical protein [Candidatus Acidoferrales bacterium]
MRRLWRLLVRVVFWSYDRGSLPYDLMVIAIVLFVLLTPRKWYHDQPSVAAPPVPGQITLLDQDPGSSTQLYRVEAGLLIPPQRAAELEQQAHAVLSRDVPALHGRTFQIVQIRPVRSGNGSVLDYEVRVKPSH